MKLSNKAIIVLGPPGSGKGTQAELLAGKFGYFQWETSSIIGKIISQAKKGDFVAIKGKKYYFSEQAKLREKGFLWDSDFVVHLTGKKIEEIAKEGKGIVLSGSPRTLDEGKFLIPFLKKLYGSKNVMVVFLKLTPKETIWRNVHRRECELATHSILYTAETSKLTKCPLDGSRLVRRKDDKAETIKLRLEEFEKKTAPLLDLFKTQKVKLSIIKGEQPVADVFKDILKSLK